MTTTKHKIAKEYNKRHRMLLALFIFLSLVVIITALSQLLWIRHNGSFVPDNDIDRSVQTSGTGPNLTYVVMGDSTAVGIGGDYKQGFASSSAVHLSKGYKLSWLNTAISGARAEDVLMVQTPLAVKAKPDIVLIVVGSNDVTHATSIGSYVKSLQGIIDSLRTNNCRVRIIVTGAADMGTPPRIPQPLRFFAGMRTKQLNQAAIKLAERNNVTFAPIAQQTGPAFRANPGLFSADNFHPNDQGYALWTPVIIDALEEELNKQPAECHSQSIISLS